MINIRNLYLSFTKEYYALADINLVINKGEKVAIIGDKESGKTTLLRVIAGLEEFKKGEVYVLGQSVKKIDFEKDINVAYLPAKFVFFENKTVRENLEYVLKIRNIDRASISKKVGDAIAHYDLQRFENEPVRNLGNFQKLLVQIARISLRKVDLFLIDDVLEGLKESEIDVVTMFLKELTLDDDITLIMAFSNEQNAVKLAERNIYLKFGSIETLK